MRLAKIWNWLKWFHEYFIVWLLICLCFELLNRTFSSKISTLVSGKQLSWWLQILINSKVLLWRFWSQWFVILLLYFYKIILCSVMLLLNVININEFDFWWCINHFACYNSASLIRWFRPFCLLFFQFAFILSWIYAFNDMVLNWHAFFTKYLTFVHL